ncbi:MAG: ACP S-malonyltransferase [Bacillota bacterium]
MPKLALLFPGQGVQTIGMGQDLAEHYPEAYDLFRQADQALGWSISQLITAGPVEQLNLTPYTQPAILATSLAYYQAWKQAGVQAEAAIGLSLGEYSALVAAEAIDYPTAVRLVHERGKAMDQGYPAEAGAVVVIIGLERETVETICRQQCRHDSFVQASNFNSPEQVVIAGDKAAVDRASAALTQAGAKRVVPLSVSAPFHTRLLERAGEIFKPHLQSAGWKAPQMTVISNVDASVYQSAEQVQRLLARQVSEPIEFAAGITRLLDLGFTHFLEVGPGSTVGGMVKKINRKAKIYRAESAASIADMAKQIRLELLGGAAN